MSIPSAGNYANLSKRTRSRDADGSAAREPTGGAERGAGSYVREWVNCGSPYCRTCAPGGQGTHGPYWYLYVWRKGKHIKRYIGKVLPQSAAHDGDKEIDSGADPQRLPRNKE